MPESKAVEVVNVRSLVDGTPLAFTHVGTLKRGQIITVEAGVGKAMIDAKLVELSKDAPAGEPTGAGAMAAPQPAKKVKE